MSACIEDLSNLLKPLILGRDSYHEIEFKFEKVTRSDFDLIKKFCSTQSGLLNEEISKTLDILPLEKSVRYTIKDDKAILDYCKDIIGLTELKPDEVIEKQRSEPPIQFKHWKGKINIKKEKPIRAKLQSDGAIKGLTYRYKMRRSFVYRSYRVDLTLVKQSKNNTDSLKEVLRRPHTYEIEIEYIGNTSGVSPEIAISEFSKAIVDFTTARLSIPFLILPEYTKIIQNQLKELMGPSFSGGPKVVELNNSHLHTLRDNKYVVTPKADGTRIMTFINSTGNIYLVSTDMSIISTECTVDPVIWGNTLIDGECIYQGETIRVLWFDVLAKNGTIYWGNETVHFDKRVSCLEKWDGIDQESKFVFQYKRSFPFDQLEVLFRTLDSSGFKTDGIILTPANKGISNKKTWNEQYKWKEIPTIDFKIVKGTRITYNATIYQEIYLQVAQYGARETNTLYAMKDLKLVEAAIRNTKSNVRTNVQFSPPDAPLAGICWVPLNESDNIQWMQAENGDPMTDGDIVEFHYDNSQHQEQLRWKARNVRFDKDAPNDIKTALSIWDIILNPITLSVIKDAESLDISKLPQANDTGDQYWKQDERKRVQKGMRNFHNHSIKGGLYKQATEYVKLKSEKVNLLELACGKAGDLERWCSCKITNVVALDLYADSIGNNKDGAIVRYCKHKYQEEIHETSTKAPACYFAVADLQKTLYNDEAALAIGDEYNTRYIAALWGREPQKGIVQIARDKFDIISIQFAIHYFTKNRESWKNFRGNIADNAKKGCYLIGTCFDGQRIANLLADVATNEWLEDSSGWGIQKNYAEEEVKRLTSSEPYGLEIKPRLPSISVEAPHPEWLITSSFLKKELAAIGFKEIKCESFAKDPNINNLTVGESRLSSLYMSFIYERVSLNPLGVKKKTSTQ